MGLFSPICVPCKKQYVIHENGIVLGRGENDRIRCDEWKCPSCGHHIYTGFGNRGEWHFSLNPGPCDVHLENY